MKNKIIFATTNPIKFVEMSTYLKDQDPGIELEQSSINIKEIQTLDHLAIAIDKAKKAYEQLKKPLLIDDTSIYMTKYYKFPGTLSKFVAKGLGFEGIKRLVDHEDRAFFQTYLAYIDAPNSIHVFKGVCEGTLIIPHERIYGDQHSPFDIFFVPDGAEVTYADMHDNFAFYAHFFPRIRSLQKFLEWYKQKQTSSDEPSESNDLSI